MIIYPKISILEVARRCNIHVKDSGRAEVRCRCPFCDKGHGKPTASINESKGLFHCFRCGEGMNAVALYAKIYDTCTQTAYKELMGIFGVS